MRLIDADELKKAIIKHLCVKSENNLLPAEKSIYDLIDKQPTVDLPKEQQPKKKQIWVIKKGNKYLHSYRAGRTSWTTKGSGISIWNSQDKSTADFFASAVNGIVVSWDGDQE